jgi:hypothetical protein
MTVVGILGHTHSNHKQYVKNKYLKLGGVYELECLWVSQIIHTLTIYGSCNKNSPSAYELGHFSQCPRSFALPKRTKYLPNKEKKQ